MVPAPEGLELVGRKEGAQFGLGFSLSAWGGIWPFLGIVGGLSRLIGAAAGTWSLGGLGGSSDRWSMNQHRSCLGPRGLGTSSQGSPCPKLILVVPCIPLDCY